MYKACDAYRAMVQLIYQRLANLAQSGKVNYGYALLRVFLPKGREGKAVHQASIREYNTVV